MALPQAAHAEFSDAIETGDLCTVASLLQQHPALVNHPEWAPPPIHCAVLWSQPKVAELLLDHGADIELRDPDRQTTPLRYAIMLWLRRWRRPSERRPRVPERLRKRPQTIRFAAF